MLNNELINIKTVSLIAITSLAIGLLLWHFNKQTKAIMGNFAALLIVVWDEVRDYFK
jgi:hypothetical protein